MVATPDAIRRSDHFVPQEEIALTVTAIRLQNFMAFEDTGWIELRPITVLFGRQFQRQERHFPRSALAETEPEGACR